MPGRQCNPWSGLAALDRALFQANSIATQNSVVGRSRRLSQSELAWTSTAVSPICLSRVWTLDWTVVALIACSFFPFLPLFLSLFHVLGDSQFKSFSKCFLSTKLDRPKKLKSTITNDSSQLNYNLTYITIRLIAELVETRRHSVYFNL